MVAAVAGQDVEVLLQVVLAVVAALVLALLQGLPQVEQLRLQLAQAETLVLVAAVAQLKRRLQVVHLLLAHILQLLVAVVVVLLLQLLTPQYKAQMVHLVFQGLLEQYFLQFLLKEVQVNFFLTHVQLQFLAVAAAVAVLETAAAEVAPLITRGY
jgi:hypothetical protein